MAPRFARPLAVLPWLLLAGVGWAWWQRESAPEPPRAAVVAGQRPLPAASAEGDAGAPDAAREAHPTGVVRLEPAAQETSGVRLGPVIRSDPPPAGAVWGQVLATQALAEARLRLTQAQSEVDQWSAPLAQAHQEAERLDALWADGGNVAHRQVDQAHSEERQLAQRQRSARRVQDGVRSTIRAEWGGMLAEALEQPDGGILAGILDGREHLLLLPSGALREGVIGLPAEPGLALPARRLAPAVQTDPASSGTTWYWVSPAASLRAGQRVALSGRAGMPRSAAGGRIPESAVVWHAGQAWVFVREDAARFQRRPVNLLAPLADGWFIGDSLPGGTMIVVQGAQLLLSEESKALIRNENGD